jgi:hypothetical protein
MTVTASVVRTLDDLDENVEDSFNLMHFSPTTSKGLEKCQCHVVQSTTITQICLMACIMCSRGALHAGKRVAQPANLTAALLVIFSLVAL